MEAFRRDLYYIPQCAPQQRHSIRRHAVSQGHREQEFFTLHSIPDQWSPTRSLSLFTLFVGFNYITPVEQRLFDYLRKEGRALFYQDDEPADPLPVTFLASPTNDLQARYISEWLTPERIAAGRKTAIVLADETLLETVLHCIPPSVEHVNITVGYPLAKAPISSLVRLYSTMLQRKALTLHSVNSLLRHPYMQLVSEKTQQLHETLNDQLCYYPTLEDLALDENLRLFFTPAEDVIERLMWLVETIARSEQMMDDFFHESVFRMYCILERMQDIMRDFDISPTLFNNLLVQIIKTTTIPFHGEPLEGIQIMGVLETRNLDFDHVLMLSCNEGYMPAHVSDTSFIPYYVRKGYSLTTIDNKVSIYRYYFEHLLKRCPDVTLVYSNATTDKQRQNFQLSTLNFQLSTPHCPHLLLPATCVVRSHSTIIRFLVSVMLRKVMKKRWMHAPSEISSIRRQNSCIVLTKGILSQRHFSMACLTKKVM